MTEPVPGGPTIRLMQDEARRLRVALVVPIYEVEPEGVYQKPGRWLASGPPPIAATR
jgi:hypothetical protein